MAFLVQILHQLAAAAAVVVHDGYSAVRQLPVDAVHKDQGDALPAQLIVQVQIGRGQARFGTFHQNTVGQIALQQRL